MAVELAELIGRLRAELTEAVTSDEHGGPGFDLGPVELELTVNVEKEAKPGARVRFWVVEAGADGRTARTARTTTQRIKLVLDPRRPLTSGTEQPGER